MDNNSFIYGGLNKDHIGLYNNNIVFYDMGSIGLGSRDLDVIYSSYYLGYRNNNENFSYVNIKKIFELYNGIYPLNIEKEDLDIIILYFLFDDLKIMIKQFNEFSKIKIIKHLLNIIHYHKLGL